jgi:mitogen-activated protein kinase 15
MGHHHHHGHDVDSEAVMTDYIATRWFRPPEILCGSQSYDFSADMWAAGCVLAEMYKGKTCFSGTNTLGQLDQIFLLLGWPSEEAIANLHSPFTRSMLEACGGEPSPEKQAAAWAELASIISNELAVDLLKRLLVVDPCARLTASSALEHGYVAPFHDPPKETSASFIAELKIDDNVKKTTANYREELYATLLPQEKDKTYRDRSTPGGKNAPDYRRTSVVA